MPASFEFLRGVLGIIGLGCAFMAGRTLALLHKRMQKLSRLYAWIIRAVVCLAAIIFRHPVDTIAMMLWGIAVALFCLAYLQTMRQKPPEDLTGEIFPHES